MRSNSLLLVFATAMATLALFIQLATALPATDLEIPDANNSTPFTCWAQFCVRTPCA